ncbi:MAG: hypothetical protein ACBR50_09785 [Microcoleus sp.]
MFLELAKATLGDSLDKIWKGIEQIGKSELVEETNSKIQENIDTFMSSSFFEHSEDEPITKEARSIIHKAAISAAAASGAMAQGGILSLDTPVLISIHVGMVIAIGALFGKKVNHANAMGILGAAAGVGIGVAGVKAVVGVFPIVGNVANATVSFSYTEALGWFCFQYFKDTVAANEIPNAYHITTEEVTMGNKGDTYKVSQAGAVGRYARSDNNTFLQSEQKQTLAQAAVEIQQLLKQLEQVNPTATEAEKIAYVNDETTPSLKRRAVGALQAGGESAIEEFLDNPYVNVGKAIVKGWLKPE